MIVPWVEINKRELECRIQCPKCGKSNYIRGTDTPYYFEVEIRDGKRVIQCENRDCAKFIPIRKTRQGVEVLGS